MAHLIMADGQPADVCGYAEAAYFAGFHFQHIAAREESERLARKAAEGRKAWERRQRERRAGARAGMTGRRAGDNPATGGHGERRPGMTSQQEADAALGIWREQRAADRRGDMRAAQEAERGLVALLGR